MLPYYYSRLSTVAAGPRWRLSGGTQAGIVLCSSNRKTESTVSMSRIAYVNGRYLPHADASVHIEDRGYQFADGVYEVVAVQDGALIDEALHLARLDRSLGELRIAAPMSRPALSLVLREVIRRNRVRDSIVYLQ